MFNEQLKNVYSGYIVDSLRKMAEVFIRENKQAEIVGVCNKVGGVVTPMYCVCDYDWEKDEELAIAVFDCYSEIVAPLSGEDSDKLSGFFIMDKKYFDYSDIDRGLPLWV